MRGELRGAIAPSDEISPKFRSLSVDSSTLSISVEQSAQKKVRHVSGCDQYVAASSSAKSTPPIGAPKAAATPAAAPAETKSRLSWSLRKRLSHIVRSRHVFDEPCERPAATIAPVWIIGPSFPSTSPLATEQSTPTTFASSVRGRSALSNPMFDPLDYSGDDDGGHARVCAQCGSTAFRQTDDSMICVECGAEVDRTAFEATDVDLGLAGGVAIGASQRQQRPSGGETAADRRLNIRARDEEAWRLNLTVPTALVFEAFQALVAALARALVDRCGCDARLLPTVEAIWARAVRTTAPQLGDTLARGAALPQLLGEAQVSRMSAGAPYAALAPPMALALCLVGCAQARQPVRAADLIAWSRNGRVPLMEAHTTIDATSPAPAPETSRRWWCVLP